MPTVEHTLQFNIPYKEAFSGVNGMVMSPAEVRNTFLWGIPLFNPVTGQMFPDSAISQKLSAAQTFVENMLDVKLFKQYVTEQQHFVLEEFQAFGFIQVNHHINRVYSLRGRFNEQQIIQYPVEWLSIKRTTPADFDYSRNLYIIPNSASAGVSFNSFISYSNQWFNFIGQKNIPNYWQIEYLTGFNVIPKDIITLIGKIAAMEILPIIEMAVTSGGYNFGTASTSLSMDGLSQSISKANGGNIFQQRVRLYGEESLRLISQLKTIYTGFKFDVC